VFDGSPEREKRHSPRTMATRTIWLHRNAPPKPQLGQPCNGCGVCCASQPCPLGILFSGRWRGRCRMLRFDEAAARYRCGLIRGVADPFGWRRVLDGWTRRWIGAGLGCDSTARVLQGAQATPRGAGHEG
jgi:hypothetical protein